MIFNINNCILYIEFKINNLSLNKLLKSIINKIKKYKFFKSIILKNFDNMFLWKWENYTKLHFSNLLIYDYYSEVEYNNFTKNIYNYIAKYDNIDTKSYNIQNLDNTVFEENKFISPIKFKFKKNENINNVELKTIHHKNYSFIEFKISPTLNFSKIFIKNNINRYFIFEIKFNNFNSIMKTKSLFKINIKPNYYNKDNFEKIFPELFLEFNKWRNEINIVPNSIFNKYNYKIPYLLVLKINNFNLTDFESIFFDFKDTATFFQAQNKYLLSINNKNENINATMIINNKNNISQVNQIEHRFFMTFLQILTLGIAKVVNIEQKKIFIDFNKIKNNNYLKFNTLSKYSNYFIKNSEIIYDFQNLELNNPNLFNENLSKSHPIVSIVNNLNLDLINLNDYIFDLFTNYKNDFELTNKNLEKNLKHKTEIINIKSNYRLQISMLILALITLIVPFKDQIIIFFKLIFK